MSESRNENQDPAEDTQELSAEELDQISGGPTAVERMLLPAVHHPSLPTDQVSLNFTKVK